MEPLTTMAAAAGLFGAGAGIGSMFGDDEVDYPDWYEELLREQLLAYQAWRPEYENILAGEGGYAPEWASEEWESGMGKVRNYMDQLRGTEESKYKTRNIPWSTAAGKASRNLLNVETGLMSDLALQDYARRFGAYTQAIGTQPGVPGGASPTSGGGVDPMSMMAMGNMLGSGLGGIGEIDWASLFGGGLGSTSGMNFGDLASYLGMGGLDVMFGAAGDIGTWGQGGIISPFGSLYGA